MPWKPGMLQSMGSQRVGYDSKWTITANNICVQRKNAIAFPIFDGIKTVLKILWKLSSQNKYLIKVYTVTSYQELSI